jgi:hypothetical protein
MALILFHHILSIHTWKDDIEVCLLTSPEAVEGGESGMPLPSAHFTMNSSKGSSTVA